MYGIVHTQIIPANIFELSNSAINIKANAWNQKFSEMWPQARVLRVDADSSRKSKGAEELFQEMVMEKPDQYF